MDSSELTDVQQRILAVIRESMQARNYAPSMRCLLYTSDAADE